MYRHAQPRPKERHAETKMTEFGKGRGFNFGMSPSPMSSEHVTGLDRLFFLRGSLRCRGLDGRRDADGDFPRSGTLPSKALFPAQRGCVGSRVHACRAAVSALVVDQFPQLILLVLFSAA